MKQMFILSLLMAAASPIACNRASNGAGENKADDTTQSSNAEREILQLENESLDILRRNDTTAGAAFVERVYADDYVVTSAEGRTYDKAAALADAKDTRNKYESVTTDDVKVRVHGDAAVVTGRVTVKVVVTDRPLDEQLRYTTFYARHGSTWQQVASHASFIEPIDDKKK